MRQKQYSETIRQHNRNTSPKPQVSSWNVRSRDETDKAHGESKRAAVSINNDTFSCCNNFSFENNWQKYTKQILSLIHI